MTESIALPCPVCESRFGRLRRDWLFRCSGCGLLASSLQPSIPQEQTLTLLDEEARLEGLYEARRRSNTVVLRTLSEALGTSGKTVLDVGCGHGIFLKDALAAGFRAEGIEPDANVVDQARATTGASIRHGYFPDALTSNDRFDAIVFNDVLEHIPSVTAAIAACYRHLRPGGILVLNCPDQDGAFYRLADVLDRFGFSAPFDRLWQVGLPSPHVWYFRARHLSQLGQKAEFETMKVQRLTPITKKGLRQRVSYVRGQSRLMNQLTYICAVALLPLLDHVPRDISVVFLRKS